MFALSISSLLMGSVLSVREFVGRSLGVKKLKRLNGTLAIGSFEATGRGKMRKILKVKLDVIIRCRGKSCSL